MIEKGPHAFSNDYLETSSAFIALLQKFPSISKGLALVCDLNTSYSISNLSKNSEEIKLGSSESKQEPEKEMIRTISSEKNDENVKDFFPIVLAIY